MGRNAAVDALPNLTSAARARIHAAVEDATDLLETGLIAASQSLHPIKHPRHTEIMPRLRSWSRACRDVLAVTRKRIFLDGGGHTVPPEGGKGKAARARVRRR
jgi:hypothetical protein